MAPQSLGAITRALLPLENEGGDVFFGEPALDIHDWLRTAPDGRGYINVLHCAELIRSPKLYAAFLLWMLAELFEVLPEVGDLDKPRLVFFFDEAHLQEKETLEEFRFLLNYRFDSMSPMAVVLVGQTELWDTKLKLQRYAAIRQRIDMCCTLPHLDRSESEQYIASHMAYSGCRQDVFTSKALDEIHKASAGIPRMINRICEKALMYAFQNQKRLIDDYMIKFVVEHEMLGSVTP